MRVSSTWLLIFDYFRQRTMTEQVPYLWDPDLVMSSLL